METYSSRDLSLKLGAFVLNEKITDKVRSLVQITELVHAMLGVWLAFIPWRVNSMLRQRTELPVSGTFPDTEVWCLIPSGDLMPMKLTCVRYL